MLLFVYLQVLLVGIISLFFIYLLNYFGCWIFKKFYIIYFYFLFFDKIIFGIQYFYEIFGFYWFKLYIFYYINWEISFINIYLIFLFLLVVILINKDINIILKMVLKSNFYIDNTLYVNGLFHKVIKRFYYKRPNWDMQRAPTRLKGESQEFKLEVYAKLNDILGFVRNHPIKIEYIRDKNNPESMMLAIGNLSTTKKDGYVDSGYLDKKGKQLYFHTVGDNKHIMYIDLKTENDFKIAKAIIDILKPHNENQEHFKKNPEQELNLNKHYVDNASTRFGGKYDVVEPLHVGDVFEIKKTHQD